MLTSLTFSSTDYIVELLDTMTKCSVVLQEDACVYTVLLGRYEQLNEQPMAAGSSLRFICFTDDPELRSESWEIRQVVPVFPRDPIRSQRDLKLRPHVHLPSFARSVYIDNSVILKVPPETLLNMGAVAPDGIVMPLHSFRETVLDEFLEVARLGFDDNARIFEQLNHYMLTCPEVLDEHPWWTAIIVREHRAPRLREALDSWALHVMRYSRRDQLSVNIALRMAGIRPVELHIDNYASELHSWPHTPGRDRKRGERDIAHSMMPLVARLRIAETKGAEVETKFAEAEANGAEVQTKLTEVQTNLAKVQAKLAKAVAERGEAETKLAEAVAERGEAETKLAEAVAERGEAETKLAEAEATLVTAQAERLAILHSTSWRITAPLRRAVELSPSARRAVRATLRVGYRIVTGRRPLIPAHQAPAPVTVGAPVIADKVMTRAGLWIYVDPDDERGRRLVAGGGSLNPPTLLAWDLLLTENAWTHVVDVGANYGEMLVNGGLPSGARVIAIEPNPTIRSRLERTLREAGLRADIIDAALSAEEGTARLLVDAAWSGTTRLASENEVAGLPVRTTTLGTILGACGPPPSAMRALVKIDVEGHEAEVLRGVLDLLPALGDFAALVEVLHGTEEELDWLEQHFDVALLELGGKPRIMSAPQGRLKELLASGQFYSQDIVLRRRLLAGAASNLVHSSR